MSHRKVIKRELTEVGDDDICTVSSEVDGVIAVIWKFRVGAPWRDLPERFGGWSNTHRRFSRWAEKGVWENLFKALADDPDNEYAMIDATIVRAHQHSAGARKKGVATRPSAARAAGSRPKSM